MSKKSAASFLLLAALVSPSHAQIQVTAVAPPRNASSATTAPLVTIDFAEPITIASVTAASFHVHGRWSGVCDGTLSLANGGFRIEFAAQRPFFAGELVTVSLSSAITAVSGRRLVGGHSWSFWTRPVRGSRSFALAATLPVRLPGETWIQTYGAHAADLDRDGAPDLSLPDELAADVRVMRNDGCGNYSGVVPHALQTGGAPSTNEAADFDGDGWLDLAVGDIAIGSLSILIGDRAGGYRAAVHYPSGRGTRGLAVLDCDGDGDPDVVTANRVSSNLALHRNRGDGTFDPATFFDGGGAGETAVVAADANGDGIADLYVGNHGSRTITSLRGDGAGNFTLVGSRGVTGQPWMITAGDVDRDGIVDAVTCNSSSPRVTIARGDGLGGLLPVAEYTTGSFPLAIDLGDLDGDGALDLVVSNYSGSSFTVRWNDGFGGFASSFTLAAPRAGSCALLVDDDRDGDLDVLGIDELADVVLLFRQTTPALPGVQASNCAASLRVDARASNAGFGGRAGHDVTRDLRCFVGIAGASVQPFGLLAGLALAPGPNTAFGILNLDATALVPLGTGTTDASGEAQVTVIFPASLPPGIAIALQGGVGDPSHPLGARLTNAETIVLR
ncbi:MAG: VCBS repeat-containing protein [Planctomycetes bacterium]|nr:VCBS repeat-containing protein [Planctomycetota bacterium]